MRLRSLLTWIFICSWRGAVPEKKPDEWYERCRRCGLPLAAGADGRWHHYTGKVIK